MDPNPRRKITRNREFRACATCRKRKLKCDRQWPCASCVKAKKASTCAYDATQADLSQGERERLMQAEARVGVLESELRQRTDVRYGQGVADAAPNGTQMPLIGAAQVNATAQGEQSVVDTQPVRYGPTHWTAMVDGVGELESAVSDSANTFESHSDVLRLGDSGFGLLFGQGKALSLQETLTTFLPSRSGADRLVAAYFRAKAVTAPFIHAKHFMRRYEEFWGSPGTASPIWTSMLFSVFNISSRTLSRHPENDNAPNDETKHFAVAAANLLTLGQYQKPQPYAVEALLLYAQAKCLGDLDMSVELGILFGMLMRLATIMGYHREPEKARTRLNTFEKEMRRRTWSLCMQLDLLVSFQLGLPVQCPDWDTLPPTNLMDCDFDEDSMELRAPRPDSDATEILFYVAKHKLMAVFRKIIQHTATESGGAHDDLAILDEELRNTYVALPSVFHSRPMAQSIADSPSVIVTRLCTSFIYQKCLCVLHRPYVTQGREQSSEICRNAGSEIIRQFLDVYKEFETSGQLETERWFMGSITWHDFLLACSALCLVTCWATRHDAAIGGTNTKIDVMNDLALLHRAMEVCKEQSHQSSNTLKVQQLIHGTIQHLRHKGIENVPPLPPSSAYLDLTTDDATNFVADFSPGQQDASWNNAALWSLDDASWAFLEPLMSGSGDSLWTGMEGQAP